MYKRIAAFLSALAVLFFLAAPVSAQELPDLQRTGSLTLWMDFEKEPLNGGSLTLYRVGDIVITDGNAGFSLIRELEDYADNNGSEEIELDWDALPSPA